MRSMIILLAISILLIAGCTTDSEVESDPCSVAGTCNAVLETDKLEDTEPKISIDKLEIYHFHGTNQCYSCITLGDYAEETVNAYFRDELDSGLIVFDHINGELPENRDLVIKYGATGSSLWLGTYDEDGFKAEENTKVWYKIKDKQAYMDYLKGVIEQKLAGN